MSERGDNTMNNIKGIIEKLGKIEAGSSNLAENIYNAGYLDGALDAFKMDDEVIDSFTLRVDGLTNEAIKYKNAFIVTISVVTIAAVGIGIFKIRKHLKNKSINESTLSCGGC